jgi:hypothetical protein
VPNYLENVKMVGLLRLRYRPHTSATGKWYEGLVNGSPGWIEIYEELQAAGDKARPAIREWEAWGT